MKFLVETTIQVCNVRGTRALDELAMHCTRKVPSRLGGLVEELNQDEQDYTIGLVDYSCRLRASGDQEAQGKASLTVSATVYVDEYKEPSDDEDEDAVEEEAQLDEREVAERRAIAKKVGRKLASNDVIGATGAEVVDVEVEANIA